MAITRRMLLASLAAVAAAAASSRVPGVAASAQASLAPPATAPAGSLLAFLRAEHDWAARELLRALERRDFSRWMAGEEGQRPDRWRLARARLAARGLGGGNDLERALSAQFERLWAALTRPEWFRA